MFCFPFICGKKNTLPSLVSVPLLESRSTETSTSSEKSTMKMQRATKKQCGKKRRSPTASTKRSSKASSVMPQTTSMKLLAGSSPCNTSNTNKQTTTGSSEKTTERKMASLKSSSQSGIKHTEQTDPKAQTSSQSTGRTTASAERKNTTPFGQINKTAAKKETEQAEPTKVEVRQSFKLLETKHIKVKEANETAKLKGSFAASTEKEERQMMALHNQERKENNARTAPFTSKNTENCNQKLMDLKISYDVKKDSSPPLSDLKNLAPPPYDGMSLVPIPFEGSTKSLTPVDENSTTPTLSSVPDKQVLPGGLPNLGNSCYINASLQCLLTAEAFCEELSYLLDISSQTIEDTFLRCFAELSRLRNGCEVRGDFNRDSLLLALINSATATKREFTIYEQNDAHEFLCHCLTHMERSWQKHVHPRSPVKTNFKFKMRNVITCSSCGVQQNDKVDVFNHISVPLVYNSVDQCLRHLVNEATPVESKCDVCGRELASSRWTFYTLPRFLILQLNRFRLSEHRTVIKLDTSINIQPELQINCSPQSDVPRSGASRAKNSADAATETSGVALGGPTSTYRLISVLSHFGSSAAYGHYVSDCFSHVSQRWMTYDDDAVSPTTQTDVLQRRSSNAYVLLYERLDTG